MDVRRTERYKIHLEEIAGSFSLHAADKQFQYMRINDVSPAGAGLVLSQALEVGTPIKITFYAGSWSVSVDGTIVWCRRQALPVGNSKLEESFRLGIQFESRNLDRNLIFFHATRSTLRTLH